MKKIFFYAAIVLTTMLLNACSQTDNSADTPTPPSAQGEVVLMYYAVGGGNIDNDVELGLGAMALNHAKYPNVRAFTQVKYSSKRHSQWSEDYEPSGDYGCVYRFELDAKALNPAFTGDVAKAKPFTGKSFKKFAGADFKMYDPQNLTDFINWCMEQAPNAKAYVLAFGNHGGSYDILKDYDKALTRGVLYDDNLEGAPCMSPAEIATAISNVPRRIDLVVFDLCVMSNLEVLSELQGLTDYVLASGHSTVQAPDHEMCLALSKITSAATVGEGITKHVGDYVTYLTNHMADYYKEDKTNVRINRSLDYTLTDMSKLPALNQSIKRVADYLKQYVGSLSETELQARHEDFDNAASFAYQYVSSDCYYDVLSYFNQLKHFVFTDDTQFAALVGEVAAAVRECHAAHDEFSFDKDGVNKKYGLSYSILLGFNSSRLDFSYLKKKQGLETPKPQGVLMVGIRYGKGEPTNPYYNKYLLENGDVYLSAWKQGMEENIVAVNNFDKENSHAYLSWDNTYRATRFDKATGWSEWMKVNPGIPYDNPPTDDDDNFLFGNQDLSEILGNDFNVWGL